MPNHCENKLYIRGPKDDLKTFQHFSRGFGWNWASPFDEEQEPDYDNHCELDLFKFIKPDNHAPRDYTAYGYGWCIDNHGTKWGCYDIDIHGGPYPSDDNLKPWDLIYSFQTAWSPFNEYVFKTICKQFINLDFLLKFYEGGCDFCGYYLYEDGEFDFNEQTITDNIPIAFPDIDDEDYDDKEDAYSNLESQFNIAWMSGEVY